MMGLMKLYVRKQLDIGRVDLVAALAHCAAPAHAGVLELSIEELWAPGQTLVTLSVRSAFDLFLRACRFAPGSEVLISAADGQRKCRKAGKPRPGI